jgi:di/tricarboxylate transporter
VPDLPVILVLGVVAGAMAAFVSGRFRVDLVALCTLAALLLLGLVEPRAALGGFASEATATVAAMFVLSAGLVRTGGVEWLVRHLGALAGSGPARLVLVLCLAIAALSAFIINTATVAIFIPVAIALSRERGASPSWVLMPLSFASQFGGVCTLIGTSTNILVSSLAVGAGLEPFGLFEFAPLGLVMCGAGIAYLVLATPRLIPEREGQQEPVDRYRLADYLAELRVEEGSPLAGLRWGEGPAGGEEEVRLLEVIRGGRARGRAGRTPLGEGDILLLHGNVEAMVRAQEKFGLKLLENGRGVTAELGPQEVKLVEALVPPRSSLVGRTLAAAGIRRRFGGTVLALQRRGKVLRERLDDIRLDGGDSLLLQGGPRDVEQLLRSDELIVTNELTELYLRKDRAVIALGIMLGVVALTASGSVPILTAAVVGALGMVIAGCLTMEEAYAAIDWKVVFLLGGVIPLGLAIERTGAAAWLASTALEPVLGFGPLAVLAALYLTTAVLTETMSNNAAAVLLAPIALSLADALGADPRPFLVAITFAASTSFATPVGYQTNTMIYAPGGYRFADYARVGGPLNLIFWALAVVLIPRFWPF